MIDNCDILIVGVGGQGSLLTARILGAYAMLIGADCKLSEVHGMAQRGGSVVSTARIGSEVFSPTVDAGNADVVLALELLEAARYKHYLKEGGLLIAGNRYVAPQGSSAQAPELPKDSVLLELPQDLPPIALNTAVLGALCAFRGFDYNAMQDAVSRCVKPDKLPINLKALEHGFGVATCGRN